MDGKKATTTKKKATSSNATKRTYTKKPKPEVSVETKAAEVPVIEEIKEQPASIGKVFEKEEKVMFMFPFEMGYSDDEQVWERSFNGVIYRFRRGVPKLIPVSVKNYVERQVWIEKASKLRRAEYQNGMGKKLNFS